MPPLRPQLLTLQTSTWPVLAVAVLLTTALAASYAGLGGCDGLDVRLPEAHRAQPIPDRRAQLHITLRRDGEVFTDGRWVAPGDLAAVLARRTVGAIVVIDADARLPFRVVRDAMTAASSHGVRTFYLRTHGDPVAAWLDLRGPAE